MTAVTEQRHNSQATTTPMLRVLCALAMLLVRTHAPALDFVDADLRKTYGDGYRSAVAAFRDKAICTPPRERYTAQHRGSPRTVGERLVLPLQERRVPIAATAMSGISCTQRASAGQATLPSARPCPQSSSAPHGTPSSAHATARWLRRARKRRPHNPPHAKACALTRSLSSGDMRPHTRT